jgi:protein TonB
MPSSRSARIVYLDEVRAPAALPAPRPPPSGRGKPPRIVLWLAVSIALHALVLALPAPRQAGPASPPALQPLDVVIVFDRATPAAAPAPDPARKLLPSKGRSPASPPKRAERLPSPATVAEVRPTLPPIAEARQPSPTAAPAGLPEAPLPPAPRSEAPGLAPQAPAAPAPALTPPSFGAAYLDNPLPVYPTTARRLGQSGLVVLKVRVSETGKPAEVHVTKSTGVDALDRAALDAVRSWTFVPARQGETPVAAWVEVPIRFRLSDSR